MKYRTLRNLALDEQGGTAVEFALVSVAFLVCMFGITYMGIMLFTNAALHWAVERSLRLAVISTTTSQSDIETAINGSLSDVGIPAATVSYSVMVGAFPVAHINATLTQTYTVPFLRTFDITYTADAYVPQGA